MPDPLVAFERRRGGPVVTALLVDWGHTLFDTAGSVDFIVDTSAALGHPINRADAAELHDDALARSRSPAELALGRDKSMAIHHECWTRLWQPLEDRCPGLVAKLYAFEISWSGWVPYVDTEPTLRALRAADIPVVIVSDVPFDLRPIFEHYGLADFVHTFILSGEHDTIKPEGRLFHIALDAVGARAEEVIMIGDNPANDGAAVGQRIRTYLMPAVRSGEPRGFDAVLALCGLGFD